MVMLRFWLNTQGNKANGNALERALRRCDREDVVNKCIFNVELVTDESEKNAAEEALELVNEEPADDFMKEKEAAAADELPGEYKQAAEELITEKMQYPGKLCVQQYRCVSVFFLAAKLLETNKKKI